MTNGPFPPGPCVPAVERPPPPPPPPPGPHRVLSPTPAWRLRAHRSSHSYLSETISPTPLFVPDRHSQGILPRTGVRLIVTRNICPMPTVPASPTDGTRTASKYIEVAPGWGRQPYPLPSSARQVASYRCLTARIGSGANPVLPVNPVATRQALRPYMYVRICMYAGLCRPLLTNKLPTSGCGMQASTHLTDPSHR